jgi:hypothetical protein
MTTGTDVAKTRKPKPPRQIRKLRLIRPLSWAAIAVVVAGAVAAALISAR